MLTGCSVNQHHGFMSLSLCPFQLKTFRSFVYEMFVFPDNLSEALEKLKLASTDSATDSVESCLDCLLKALAKNSERSFDLFFLSIQSALSLVIHSAQLRCE